MRLMVLSDVKRAVGYVRVSTAEQGRSGLGLEAQKSAIQAEAQRKGWELIAIYEDVASGKSTNGRHQLDAALKDLADRRADALVVTKLDRLSRSVVDFGKVLKLSEKHKWPLVIVDLGLDTSTAAGKLTANVLISVAEWEAAAISERTKAALGAAKARGTRLGRATMIDARTERRIVALRRRGHSLATIATKLNATGSKAPRGGAWTWQTIERVVRRNMSEPITRRARRVSAQ